MTPTFFPGSCHWSNKTGNGAPQTLKGMTMLMISPLYPIDGHFTSFCNPCHELVLSVSFFCFALSWSNICHDPIPVSLAQMVRTMRIKSKVGRWIPDIAQPRPVEYVAVKILEHRVNPADVESIWLGCLPVRNRTVWCCSDSCPRLWTCWSAPGFRLSLGFSPNSLFVSYFSLLTSFHGSIPFLYMLRNRPRPFCIGW